MNESTNRPVESVSELLRLRRGWVEACVLGTDTGMSSHYSDQAASVESLLDEHYPGWWKELPDGDPIKHIREHRKVLLDS